jgi:antitoxin YefM
VTSGRIWLYLFAVAMPEQMPLAEVKNRLAEVVDEVEREHARVVITKHGRPVAVVVSAADLESLEETLAVMGNAALLADIREAVAGLVAGAAVPLSKDEALRMISRS